MRHCTAFASLPRADNKATRLIFEILESPTTCHLTAIRTFTNERLTYFQMGRE
jgi:hypothetical protein